MGNSNSDALNIEVFWGSTPPELPRGSRLQCTLQYAFVLLARNEKIRQAPAFSLQRVTLIKATRAHINTFTSNPALYYERVKSALFKILPKTT